MHPGPSWLLWSQALLPLVGQLPWGLRITERNVPRARREEGRQVLGSASARAYLYQVRGSAGQERPQPRWPDPGNGRGCVLGGSRQERPWSPQHLMWGGEARVPVPGSCPGQPLAGRVQAAAQTGLTRQPVDRSTSPPTLGSWIQGSPFSLPGLAVHQIITITVSLIMVIAALITTLVLKNW